MESVHTDIGDHGVVAGYLDPAFEKVHDAFAANFTQRDDLGAQVCVYRDGRPVVDLHGGRVEGGPGGAYGPDTLQLVFSTTKGATALCAHILVQRGELDLDAPVERYWPEFAAAGKSGVPVRYLLTHQVGLPTVDVTLRLDEALAWTPVTDALAGQEPMWPPGSAHGYHALTFGWLVGEVVRRVSGRTLGRFFADEVAAPLGLEFWIGLPAELEERVAPLRQYEGAAPDLDPATLEMYAQMFAPGALAPRALTLNGAFGDIVSASSPFNRRDVHAAEVPAANGVTNAASLARMYAATIGPVDGVRVLDAPQMEAARVVQVDGPDRVLSVESRIGTGFMCHSDFSPMLADGSFGHAGAGGSLGFADPASGIAFGYVMNQMRLGLAGDLRTTRLVDAVAGSL